MAEEVPPIILFNGRIVPWHEATIHVWSETSIRAANVFEGLRAYWDPAGELWRVVQWDRHMRRLAQSATIFRIPHDLDSEKLLCGVTELLRRGPYREHLYLRPTIFIESGSYGFRPETTKVGTYCPAFPIPRGTEVRRLRCMVSSWRRSSDLIGPPRAKAGSNYGNIRLSRVEASERGFDDAVMLNDRGNVAELTGAALFLVRDGVLLTPPVTAGILESITRDLVMQLATRELGVKVVEREIDRTELYVAQEIFGVGTLLEVAAVVQVDGVSIGDRRIGPISQALADRYSEIVEGQAEDRYGWLTPILAAE